MKIFKKKFHHEIKYNKNRRCKSFDNTNFFLLILI